MYARYLGHIVILLIIAITFCGCERRNVAQIRPVQAEQVEPSIFTDEYSYAGVVQAYQDLSLSFQVGGKVARRYVEVGDTVKPGQLLAKLDTKDLTFDKQNLEADVKSAESAFVLAKSDLNRYGPLLKSGFVSKSFYEQTKTKFETQASSLEKAKSLLALASRKLAYADLYAEYPGIITKLLITEGEVVAPGQVVMELARSDEKEIVISVPEQRIQQWQSINKIDVRLWAYPERKYMAKVREIAGDADPVTRTYTIKLSVMNADSFMQLGMTANIKVDQASSQPLITLPLTAIAYEGSVPLVWIINMKDMTVHPSKVTLGHYANDKIIVTNGLQAKQWVVTAGVNSLHPGQKIKLLKE